MERQYKDSGIEWIGRIPKEWKTCRFKNFIELRTEPSTSVHKIGLENIESESGRYIKTGGTFEGNGVQFYKGDVVYGKLRPYLRKVWLATFDGNAVGDFFVFKSKDNVNATYLKWLLLSDGFTEAVNSSVYGAKMPRVSSDFIFTLPFYLPSLPEQRRIADYLDKKCGEIDGLVSLQEQMIQTLADYKQSVITEAVTKGLNPNAHFVPSGIDWIGEIPEHWRLIKVGYIFQILDYLRQPISAELRERNNPQYDYYGASGVIDKIDHYNVDDKVLLIGEDGANLVMRNLPLVYKAEGKFWVNNHAHILKPIKDDYNFMAHALEAANYRDFITGSAQPKLSQENLQAVKLPVPPLSEQHAIASYLDTKCSEIDSLIALKRQKIDMLKDYKKSVIYEAVTGKTGIEQTDKASERLKYQ